MTKPRVSIIIPVYNSAETLPRAVQSVIDQTYSNWELIIVDDDSDDDIESAVAPFVLALGDQIVYKKIAHAGCGGARNAGIQFSQGELICFLDADDTYLPDKLAKQVEFFDLKPELGLVYSDFSVTDLHNKIHPSEYDSFCPAGRTVALEKVYDNYYFCGENLFDVMIRYYIIATIVGMVRREVISTDIRFAEGDTYSAEWLFYLKIVKRCMANDKWKVGFIDEPTCMHYWTKGSNTRTNIERNHMRMVNLARSMQSELQPLNKDQNKIISKRLSKSILQLGFDAYHARNFQIALTRFKKACKVEPSMRNFWNYASTIPRAIFNK